MELHTKEIPEIFRLNVPPGFRIVELYGHEYLAVDSIFCRHGHSLLVDSVKIHGKPSIKMHVTIGDHQGMLFVDAFWGSHAKLFNFLPLNAQAHAVVEAYCPVCGVSLMEPYQCSEPGCGSQEGIILYLPGNDNTVHVCARLNCPNHKLEISDVPPELVEQISHINYFGEGADDIFGDF